MNTKTLISVLVGIVALGAVGYALTQERDTHRDMEDNHHDATMNDYEIYPGDVAEKMRRDEDIVLLDVRTPEEYAEVHLENAHLLPVQELSQQSLAAIGLGEDAKDKEIILYCRSGARSKTAYDIMQSLGYTNIKSVQGGMIHWEEDQYPFTETGEYEGVRAAAMGGESASTEVADGPSITLDRTLHNFGLIPQYGGNVETTFTVTNTGTETLTVGGISTSCACTTAEISATDIPAGESAVLTVTFDPDLHAEPLGVFKRTVFIPTNDPNTPEAEVNIQVDIDEGV